MFCRFFLKASLRIALKIILKTYKKVADFPYVFLQIIFESFPNYLTTMIKNIKIDDDLHPAESY